MSIHPGRPGPRRFSGKWVAITLMTSIVAVAIVAQIIHVQNLRARRGAAAETSEPSN